MQVAQIQQSKVGSSRHYSKGQPEAKTNQSQMAFGKDNVSRQSQKPTATELRTTQLGLKEQISVMLQTETDPKKIKKLNNYRKALDVLLENGRKPVVKAIKGTPAVAFGSRKSDAQAVVHVFSGTSATIAAAMAQMPGFDEAALAANDVAMAIAICKIYDLSITKSIVTTVIAPLMGNTMGTAIFGKIVSKGFTWVPVLGNGLNAAVAGSVTEVIGHGIIGKCESGEIQKAIKRFLDKQR